jgi:hypothetical protein
MRLGVKTAYMPNVVDFFQPCSVKFEPAVKGLPSTIKGLVWNANTYINDEYYWHAYETQMILSDIERYKYYGFEHDLSALTTTHYMVLT